MSVINKMLRDLDHPQLSTVARLGQPAGLASLTRGTLNVNTMGREQKQFDTHKWWFVFALLAVAALVSVWGWYQWGLHAKADEIGSTVARTVEPDSILAAGADLMMDIQIGSLSLRKSARVPMNSVIPIGAIAPRERATPASMTAVHDTKALNPRRDEVQLANDAPIVPVRREVSALEMAGQAQRLWNDGSRDAAIGLLKDALAVVEGAAGIDMAGTAMADWIPVVRELARMELAEGQTGQVLDLLRRLEPALSGQADLWAVRANAAQRLGAHHEATQAYQRALALRPGEPRWMLGAAVSMAANGQTADAMELAQRARAAGVVSRDVVTYLKQLGVPLPD